MLLLEKRDAEADDLLRKTLPVQVRTLGAEDADTLATQAELARVMVDEKRYAEAETLARATWTVQCKKLGVYHADSMSTLVVLSKALIATGRYPQVKSLFETTISQVEQLHAPALPMVWRDYGSVAVIAKDYDAAIDHLRKAVALGYDAGDLADQNEMKPLLDDPRFKALTATTRK